MPSPSSHLSARALVAAATILAVVVAVALDRSALGMGEHREAAAALETAAGLIGLLLALLALGRFRQSGLFSDFALVHALAVLVFTNVFLSGLPAFLGVSPLQAGAAPLASLGAAVSAVLFAVASAHSHRQVTPAGRAWVDLVAVFLASAAVVYGASLLARTSEVAGHGVRLADIAAAIGFAAACVGFTRAADRTEDLLLRWLAVGTALACVARLSYAVAPDHGVLFLVPGDILRAAFYVALSIGAVLEIRRYWQESVRAATAQERRRIARDLHDGLAQELAYIATASSMLDVPDGDEHMRRISAASERALDETRRALLALTATDDEPLEESIIRTCEELASRLGTSVHLHLQPGIALPTAAREDLLRILREALTNAVRHGYARHVSVRLSAHDGIALRVSDNGVGFDPETTRNGGFGLQGMRERAAALGGSLHVRSSKGSGTVVKVTIP